MQNKPGTLWGDPDTIQKPAPAQGRLGALDGLRGLAALVVLLHHSLLVIPALAAPYYGEGPAELWTAEWWLSHSPLHALWEGKAAVYVFFILSGFVLQSMVSRPNFRWASYYPQRLLRLYLPVWGAVLFTVATYIMVPRLGQQHSLWLAERPETLGLVAFIKDMTLLLGNGGLASPLWSLRFEILFSLALPLYVWASKIWPGLTYLKLAGCLAIITAGGYLNETMFLYVPMFLIGTIMAEHVERFRALGDRIGRARAGWPFALGSSVLLMASPGVVGGLGVYAQVQGATAGLATVGAAITVLMAIHWPAARKILETTFVTWLGTISFSLYLVHEPIVVAFGFAFGAEYAVPAVIASIAVSIPVAVLFYAFVEKPSHELSKKIGRWR
jgi:peptidoglycan/LPS O-acetylase OafA/YrhL